ncbi:MULTISPECIES: cytochrome c-type biogenesis protein [unclassified Duganella]|uniref:cytochrome c-type biogenesis protein n=1 Tax=unclassified Duganella TaxID=2636909 RepID=UPI0008820A8D|nr:MULTISPECIES: cytochrome c-type biogenesis protein [unclassified Duganella]SDH14093.1 cytochrome c-type biogenesis protein CcmH [Duganella sp. OV458]SDK28651.1 cytochrome c-type biogenesis protein CcmH [Duganella sp. OV510]
MVKLIAALMMTLALAAHAEADLDKRAAALEEELRCLVCQNQTIADSHAGLASDLRREVREQLAQGKSEQEVLDFMVQRYGDFVLYRPPVKSTTWLLWFGPFLLLAAGALLLASRLRAARARAAEAPPSEEALQRARALLDNHKEQP